MSQSELEQKQHQLDELQKSFNDYVESSKELESELEVALEDAAEKIDRSSAREEAAEKKANDLQSKVDELIRENVKLKSHTKSTNKGSDSEELNFKLRQLENENENLSNQVRILEATEEDFQHKIQSLEEDIIFLKTDIEAVTLARDEFEVEMKEEVATLEKKLSTSEGERRQLSKDIAAITNKLMNDPNGHDPADDRVQMLLFKQDKDIDFIKSTLDALAEENSEANKHNHHDHHSPMWHEKIEELRGKLHTADQEKHALAAEVAALNKKLDALSNEDSEVEDLRYLSSKQEREIVFLNARLREMEAAKEEAEKESDDMRDELDKVLAKLQAQPKIESRGTYISNAQISSSSHTLIQIDSTSTTHVSISQIISSGDSERMKSELLKLAQQYDSLRSSNTRMLNKLQALQGTIQVCCRTRPPSYQELSNGGKICIDAADDTELMCYDGRSEVWKSFFFDRVWKADANQAEVFADVEPMVVSVLDGYNACILAYGQTGSGKTFTMDGYGDQYGANYRTIQKLFDLLILRKVQAEAHSARVDQLTRDTTGTGGGTSNGNSNGNNNKDGTRGSKRKSSVSNANGTTNGNASNNNNNNSNNANGSSSNNLLGGVPMSPKTNNNPNRVDNRGENDETDDTNSVHSDDDLAPFTFSLTISMMEIYNEQVYDLLHANAGGGQSDGVSLDIRQGPDNSVSVPGLQQMSVHSLQDVMSVFSKGTSNRATASTNLNERSSRSHLIVQVDVTTQRGGETPVRGRLNLVDLAGSERVGKSGATGATMKEAQHINKSLSALGDVMEALDQKSKHIPYRNSKLTYLLQHSLGGNSRTMMIVTVCPTDLTFEESLFTLQFATRVRNITVGPAQKQSNAKNLEVTIKTLRGELKELKKSKTAVEEALHEMKKEQKKVPPSALMEAKLKTIEEARKAAEILMQQLNRQITDCNVKLSDEKESKEQLMAELNTIQKNLKKALEQIRDLTRANERLEMLLKKKDNEVDTLQQQLIRLQAEPAPLSTGNVQRLNAQETPLPTGKDPSSKPPPGPSSAPAGRGGISSSARRILPTGSAASSVLSAPLRKKTSSSLKEFMLPTASSVAHIAASAADHAAHSEEVAQLTHGPANPSSGSKRSLSPPGKQGSGSFALTSMDTDSVSGSDSYNGGKRSHSSSWQDVLAPTAARQAHILAAEAEHAARAEEAARATHAGHTRLSISPASARPTRRDSEDGSVTSTLQRTMSDVQYVNPKGHSSWEDAMAPTAARKAAMTAAEEDYARRAQESSTATHGVGSGRRFSVSPASGRGRMDNDDNSVNTARSSNADYINPKGHSSWQDAMAPTAARKAALTAQEEDYNRRAQESSSATHAVGLGRFSVSPSMNRWENDDNNSTAGRSVNSDYVNPKGHSSWYDAMAPTAARQAAIAATEAEHYAHLENQSPSASFSSRTPWVPTSKDPGRPPTQQADAILYADTSRQSRAPLYNGSSSSSSAPARDSSVNRRASVSAATPSGSSTSATQSQQAVPSSAVKRASTGTASAANTTAGKSASSEQSSNTNNNNVSLLASSSMVRRTNTTTAATESMNSMSLASRMPTLSVRSEEAMKRHQLRMDKRREVTNTTMR